MVRGWFILCFVIAAGVLVGGCASASSVATSIVTGQGNSMSGVQMVTSVSLTQDDYVIVKTNVAAQCKGFSLLGFIPIVPAELSKTMDRLYARAELQPGQPQAFANLMVEHTGSYYLLFSIPKTSVHADVVQFKSRTGPTAGANTNSASPP